MLDPFALGDRSSTQTEDALKPFFDREFFTGQFKAAPKAGDTAKIDADEVTWQAVQGDGETLKFHPRSNAMYLAVAYVISAAEVSNVFISIGSDDSSCWRVNGEEVLRVYEARGVEADQDKSKTFTLHQGVNVISAAIINGGGEVGLSARFYDGEHGVPIKDIVVSLTPPAK